MAGEFSPRIAPETALGEDIATYHKVQLDYFKCIVDRATANIAAEASQKAYQAKLIADKWLRERFQKIEFGDIAKEGEDDIGAGKDAARNKNLEEVIHDTDEQLKALYNPVNDSGSATSSNDDSLFQKQALGARLTLLKEIKTEREVMEGYLAPMTFRDWMTKIGSALLNLDYAILCGISVFAGVQALGWPVYSSLWIALFSAVVTAGVNLWGFRHNILSLLQKSKKQIPALINGKEDTYYMYTLYYLFVGVACVTALITTALAASTVPGTLGIEGYWAQTSVVMLFGITFIALWGLFTQEPRKWFEGKDSNNPQRNDAAFLERTKNSLSEIFGLKADKDLVDATKEAADYYHLGRTVTRLGLFLLFTGITSYASIMLAPRATELFLSGVHSFFDKTLTSGALGGDAWLTPVLSTLFIIGTVIYNAATAQKLATFFTRAAFGLPLATDDGKKHGFFYKYAYPFFAGWNAVNNGAFNGSELNKSNETGADAGSGAELTSTEKMVGSLAIASATSRSFMFFSATRAGQHAVEMEPLEPRIQSRLTA